MVSGDYAIQKQEVEAQLERLLVSGVLQPSQMLCDMLRFVVEETLAGRQQTIKGYTLATRVFNRPDDFDSSTDPIVRIHAGRLRRRLSEYYAGDGADDPVIIEIPKGGYVPQFAWRTSDPGPPPDQRRMTGDAKEPGSAFDGPSVAVLPFATIGGETDVRMLADGICDELTMALVRFEGLAVIASQSMLRYRNSIPTIEQVGKDLGVRYVVSGSVRQVDDAVRVAAQLGDCRDSSQIWADVFQRDLSVDGLFEIQNELTNRVVANISDEYGAIPRQLTEETRGKRPEELTVYEAALRFYQYNLHGNPEHQKEAREAIDLAIKVDPEYALGWALLAEMNVDAHNMGFEGPDEPLELAHRQIHHALGLDPCCQQAQSTSAYIHFVLGEYETAIETADRAIELNPNSPYQVAVSAFWIGLSGELDRACEILDTVEKLIPFTPGWMRLVPLLRALDQNDNDGAYREAAVFTTPSLAWDSLLRAATAALVGKTRVATAAYREFTELFPEEAKNPEPYIRGFVHADRHVERLLEGLSIAAELAKK